jgi:hypothetical protein
MSVNLRLRAPRVPLVVSHLDLHSKHIPLPRYGVPHDQEADIFVAERVKLSEFCFNVAHGNVAIKAIITIFGPQVSNGAVVIIIEAKFGISIHFSIVRALVVHIICVSFIIVQAGSPPLLLRVDQLRRSASRSEEEKQDQCELHTMPLRREGRSIARPVIVEQEQEVVDSKDRLLLDRDIEVEVRSQVIVDVLE